MTPEEGEAPAPEEGEAPAPEEEEAPAPEEEEAPAPEAGLGATTWAARRWRCASAASCSPAARSGGSTADSVSAVAASTSPAAARASVCARSDGGRRRSTECEERTYRGGGRIVGGLGSSPADASATAPAS